MVDSLVTSSPFGDLNRSQDFHFDVDRWSLHRNLLLGNESEEVASDESMSVLEGVHRRVALLTTSRWFDSPKCADNSITPHLECSVSSGNSR